MTDNSQPSSSSASPERRRRGILRRGSKQFKVKHTSTKSSNSSTSSTESRLAALLSSTSLSKSSYTWPYKRKRSSKKAKLDCTEMNLSAVNSEGDFKPCDLPFDPVLRAGILIVVTSPEGELSLGLCDGETSSTVKGDKK